MFLVCSETIIFCCIHRIFIYTAFNNLHIHNVYPLSKCQDRQYSKAASDQLLSSYKAACTCYFMAYDHTTLSILTTVFMFVNNYYNARVKQQRFAYPLNRCPLMVWTTIDTHYITCAVGIHDPLSRVAWLIEAKFGLFVGCVDLVILA